MSLGLNYASVAIGGALGACARYTLSLWLAGQLLRFPYATLVANVTGGLLAGLVATWFWQRGTFNSPAQLVLVVGFLGGFTTFSAFSVETLRLVEAGDLSLAGLNVVVNVCGALLAVFVGASVARML